MTLTWKCDWCGEETFPSDPQWTEIIHPEHPNHYCKDCAVGIRICLSNPPEDCAKIAEMYPCFDRLLHSVEEWVGFPNNATEMLLRQAFRDVKNDYLRISKKLKEELR